MVVIYGYKTVKKTDMIIQGAQCPDCRTIGRIALGRIKRVGTVFWLPVISVTCKGFQRSVLDDKQAV